jgi:hypothetical protein
MKETINIDVELKDFLKKTPKSDYIIVNQKGKWVAVSKEEFLKDTFKKIQSLEDEIESYRLDNKDMKNKIKKFENALIQYGFNLINGGER